MINKDRLDRFMARYEEQLALAVANHPREYFWGDGVTVASVAAKMRLAFERGTFSIGGRALQTTCKLLGIRHGRKALNDWLHGGTP